MSVEPTYVAEEVTVSVAIPVFGSMIRMTGSAVVKQSVLFTMLTILPQDSVEQKSD